MDPALRRHFKTNLGIICSHRINHKYGSESVISIFSPVFVDGVTRNVLTVIPTNKMSLR